MIKYFDNTIFEVANGPFLSYNFHVICVGTWKGLYVCHVLADGAAIFCKNDAQDRFYEGRFFFPLSGEKYNDPNSNSKSTIGGLLN